MAIEQSWSVVAPTLFTANGTTLGVVTVADTAGFKVKSQVIISMPGLPDLTLQCKRVVSTTQLIVGPIPITIGQDSLTTRTNISAYTVLGGAFIYAEEQPKRKFKEQDIWQAVYDQEPTVALRTVGVDEYGNYWNESNPLPVAFSSAFPNVVKITSGDGSGYDLNVNPDGSLNVVVENGTGTTDTVRIPYNEVTSVPAGVETTVLTYTCPPTLIDAFLQRIMVSGDNVAKWDILLNGSKIATKRTWWTDFNVDFSFTSFDGTGVSLNTGDIITVEVLHNSSTLGTFEATIQVVQLS
jgi:hypothetical protein